MAERDHHNPPQQVSDIHITRLFEVDCNECGVIDQVPTYAAAIQARRTHWFDVHRVKALAERQPRTTDVPHGTWNGYNWHGCRCAECRAANHAKNKARRERRRSRPIPAHVQHGSYVTYGEYGCRCQPCVTANREYFRQWRSGRVRARGAQHA